jgi:uncharacterized damage-inducible protein DinB
MLPILKDYFALLTNLHEGITTAVAGLPVEALDWQPGPEMNSMAVLVVHTAGAERYWIAAVAGQQDSQRDRPAEFRTAGMGEGTLVAHLDRALAECEQTLAQLTLEDLEARRHAAIQDRECTAMWALLHALEHTALHLGHIQVTRQMWKRANPR